jgi:hypothetical protein
LNFDEITARIVMNLNLPMQFFHRLQFVAALVPPNTAISSRRFWHEASMHRNACRQRTGDDVGRCFTGERYFFDKETSTYRIGIIRSLFCSGNHGCKHQLLHRIRRLISTETKAIALIILTLKLLFGLDDRRELIMSELANRLNTIDENGRRYFSYTDWALQLRLRIAVWRGSGIADVLSKGFAKLLFVE